jgi:excinuclease ABC subunit A
MTQMSSMFDPPSSSRTAMRRIELRGVRVHNLKNIDLDIPLGQVVVVSGISGSGKSSLAFDTIFAEGQRRYIESFSVAARQHLERIDRPDADRIAHVPPAIAIRSDRVRRGHHDARSTVATTSDLIDGLRMLFARAGRIVCPGCHSEVQSHSEATVVRVVSAIPAGTRCQLVFAASRSIEHENSVAYWLARGFSRGIWNGKLQELGTKPDWPAADPIWIVVDRFVAGKSSIERIGESAKLALHEGAGRCSLLIEAKGGSPVPTMTIEGRDWQRWSFHRQLVCDRCKRAFLPVDPRLLSHFSTGACPLCRGTGKNPQINADGNKCAACHGTRFREEARAVHIGDRSIADICSLNATLAIDYIRSLGKVFDPDATRMTELIRAEIEYRLTAVIDLGLGYLSLDRAAETLSGGESRRLMLAAVIGSKITGTLVVVDEPSAGLSPAEIPHVIEALRKIQRLRNSVIAVEHSPLVVAAADHAIELGPAAGPAGGHVIFQGPPSEQDPVTHRVSERPSKNSSSKISTAGSIHLGQIQQRHLQLLEIEFPIAAMTVVHGPSGSGKTTLLTQVLFPLFQKRLGQEHPGDHTDTGTCELSGGEEIVEVAMIDQAPLTRSARSNPATWLEVFDEIRQTFAATLDAKQRGFTAQHFSFNSPSGGRCRGCQGTGLLKQDMQFLPDVTLVCPECHGTRYRREILEVKYRGRSIADVLAMSVSDAASFFRSQPRVQYRFQLLKQIGLDYLVLGQPSETLSGGEAQRLKLAARLAIPNRGPCLIICDDPTTGLHPTDTAKLIECFHELTANGHTLVIADNSPELVSAADRTVELKTKEEATR